MVKADEKPERDNSEKTIVIRPLKCRPPQITSFLREDWLRANVVRPESHPFYEKISYERTKTQHVYARSSGNTPALPG